MSNKHTLLLAVAAALIAAAAANLTAAPALADRLPSPDAPAAGEPTPGAPGSKSEPRDLPSWGRGPAPKPPVGSAPAPGDSVAGAPAGRGKQAADTTAKAAASEPADTPAQRRRSLDDLYAHLATASSADEATPLVFAIERLWLFTGSDTIDVLMERVLKLAGEQRLDVAEKVARAIVDMAPRYAEGWNRLALVAYLRNDYSEALSALHRALALEPNHFKALDGIAQIMRETGEKKAALDTYKKLIEVHPYWSGASEAMDELKREVEGQGI